MRWKLALRDSLSEANPGMEEMIQALTTTTTLSVTLEDAVTSSTTQTLTATTNIAWDGIAEEIVTSTTTICTLAPDLSHRPSIPRVLEGKEQQDLLQHDNAIVAIRDVESMGYDSGPGIAGSIAEQVVTETQYTNTLTSFTTMYTTSVVTTSWPANTYTSTYLVTVYMACPSIQSLPVPLSSSSQNSKSQTSKSTVKATPTKTGPSTTSPLPATTAKSLTVNGATSTLSTLPSLITHPFASPEHGPSKGASVAIVIASLLFIAIIPCLIWLRRRRLAAKRTITVINEKQEDKDPDPSQDEEHISRDVVTSIGMVPQPSMPDFRLSGPTRHYSIIPTVHGGVVRKVAQPRGVKLPDRGDVDLNGLEPTEHRDFVLSN